MTTIQRGDLSGHLDQHIARVVIQRPEENFLDATLIEDLATVLEELDANPDCRVIILASEGRCFCAGGNLFDDDASNPLRVDDGQTNNPLYLAAVRLFRIRKPIIAEIQGAAVGGGLGLAVMADFRIAGPKARFAANFVKLGVHPGFGLSHTLPRLIGEQRALLMFLTGRRIKAEEALAWGLVDQLVAADALTATAMQLAREIAEGAPLAVQSTRATQRGHLADAVLAATQHEFREQNRLAKTADFVEGLKSVAERRPGVFLGR